MRDRADMVFMRVRDDERDELLVALGNELRIGHLDVRFVDAGCSEGDPAVDHKPSARVAE